MTKHLIIAVCWWGGFTAICAGVFCGAGLPTGLIVTGIMLVLNALLTCGSLDSKK